MDVNLTGQIAANLVEALKPPWYNPLLSASAGVVGGVIGGVVGGLLALAGVWMANKSAEEREERNHKAEAQRIRREELKKAYINYIHFKRKIDLSAKSGNPDAIKLEEIYDALLKYDSELLLLRPEMKSKIDEIFAKYHPLIGKDFPTEWLKISADLDNEVISLMQADLKMDDIGNEEAKKKGWWQFWK